MLQMEQAENFWVCTPTFVTFWGTLVENLVKKAVLGAVALVPLPIYISLSTM